MVNWLILSPRFMAAWNPSLLLLLQSLQPSLLFYETPVLIRAGLSSTFVFEMTVLLGGEGTVNNIMIIERKYQKILQID